MTKTTTIHRFLAIAILAMLIVLLPACGGQTVYYQYKAGESNFHAANTKCQVEAEKIKHGVADVRSNNIFDPAANMSARIMTSINKNKAAKAAYEACLADLGWLPCSAGGTASHGCEDTSSVDPQSNKTPLHQAAEKGDTVAIERLIAEGADIHAQKGNGATPLHTATGYGHADSVRALIIAGANIEAKSDHNITPLHVAAAKGQTETANALIKARANVYARMDSGETPLDIAIHFHGKDSEIARILREAMKKQGG